MARTVEFTYSYRDLSKLSGLPMNAVYRHTARGTLNPADLASVATWLARHGKFSLRKRIVASALYRELEVGRKGK